MHQNRHKKCYKISKRKMFFGSIFCTSGILTGVKFSYDVAKIIYATSCSAAIKDPFFWITAGAGIFSIAGAFCLAIDSFFPEPPKASIPNLKRGVEEGLLNNHM